MSADLAEETCVPYGTAPPYATGDPAAATVAVLAACAAALATAEELGSASATPSWDNLVVPLDAALERIDREYGLVSHLHAVTASPAWDAANTKCLAELAKAQTLVGQHAGLYGRLRTLAATRAPALAAGQARILNDTLAGFALSGVDLPAADRKEFAASEQQLSQLGATFEEQVRAATASWAEMVDDPAALGDMPADLQDAAATAGGWQVTLLDPSYLAYMTHGTDRSLRERLARARNARASDLDSGTTDNLPLVREIMRLRWQQAGLLGHASPAAMILTRRMAGNPETVADFLSRLAATAHPQAQRELTQLREFAATKLGLDTLEPWDMAFVAERYKQATTGLAESEVRPYFGMEKVLAGLFACAGNLFGIRFAPVERPVWDPGTRCLAVTASDGQALGHLYLDLQARPTKRGGAWAHGALARCRGPAGRQLPVALVNCNFTGAASGAAARLGWEEVVTLFHEAGHALHHLLGKVDDYCASGMNGVEWDAVELPSQFMENFAWQPEVAIGMSAHAVTGAPLPPALFAKLEAQRSFLPGLSVTRQLAFARYDLELHRQPGADPLELWDAVARQNLVVPLLAADRTPCAFGHVFAGGYATGYYGYLWADVLAADAYEMFMEPGADQARLGRHFAAEVLERGGSRDAADNFRALRGRQPDPAALLRRLGLA